jgi:hypothetical protein
MTTQTVGSRELAAEVAFRHMEMISTMRELWQQAQAASTAAERLEKQVAACAVAEKAAPYIHPRLGAVAATVRQVTSITDLSDAEIEALLRSMSDEVIEGSAEPLALPAGKQDLN